MPVERILPGLCRVGGGTWDGTVPALSFEGDANAYLLQGPDGHVLIDPGSAQSRTPVEGNLREAGVDPLALSDLLLTHSHWDHTQDAHAWQTAHGLRTHLSAVGVEYLARGDLRLVGTYLHGPGYPFTPFAVDHAVVDGETFELAGTKLTAHALPGHTPDSTVFLFEHAGVRVGLCGDVAFGPRGADRNTIVGFLCALWGSNLDDYVASLERLEAMEIDLLLPGHGAVVKGREAVRSTVRAGLDTVRRLAADRAVRQSFGVAGDE